MWSTVFRISSDIIKPLGYRPRVLDLYTFSGILNTVDPLASRLTYIYITRVPWCNINHEHIPWWNPTLPQRKSENRIIHSHATNFLAVVLCFHSTIIKLLFVYVYYRYQTLLVPRLVSVSSIQTLPTHWYIPYCQSIIRASTYSDVVPVFWHNNYVLQSQQ